MGWSSGSRLMSDIIGALMEKIPEEKARQEIYEELIPIFESHDCDTLQECADDDIAFHDALYIVDEAYRAWFDDLDDEYGGDTLDFEEEED